MYATFRVVSQVRISISTNKPTDLTDTLIQEINRLAKCSVYFAYFFALMSSERTNDFDLIMMLYKIFHGKKFDF